MVSGCEGEHEGLSALSGSCCAPGHVVIEPCYDNHDLTEGVHQLGDQVEDGHLERNPALLPGLHADEQAVEAVCLPVQAVSGLKIQTITQ